MTSAEEMVVPDCGRGPERFVYWTSKRAEEGSRQASM